MRMLSWGRLVIAGALASTAGLVAPSAAPVAAAEGDIVALVIDGTGFGHGRGMSQWGAYGYAVDHGWNWNQILDHYYGGTEAGTVPASERIRVRLTKLDGAGTVGVISHGAPITWNGQQRASMYAKETSTAGTFEVWGSTGRSCPGASTLIVPDGNPPIATGAQGTAVEQIQQFLRTYQPTAGGIAVDGDFGNQTRGHLIDWQNAVGVTLDGTWGPEDAAKARQIIAADTAAAFTLLGTETATAGDPVSFSIANGDDTALAPELAIGLCAPDRSVTHYRGSIDVLSTSSGNRVVNDVGVQNYVRGVIPREISASWADAGDGAGINALQAQAVAARSYGLEQRRSYFYNGTSTRYATTCDTTACQVYGGAARRGSATGNPDTREDSRTDAAVAATANVVRRWPAGHSKAGQLVSTEFSASNGPRTAGGAFPPVDDIGDDTLLNPNHRWTRVIDADTLESRFGLGQITAASMVDAAASQYQGYDGIWFDDISLTSTAGSERMNSWEFRNAFNLPSPGFTVRVVKEAPTPTRFGFIGDSVGASITTGNTSEFRSLIDGSFDAPTISAVSGRCTNRSSCSGTSGVDIARGLPFGLDLVVVELGYNDSASRFPADIAEMMSALTARGVKQVAWVNLAEIRQNSGGFTYRPHNDALDAATAQWPNLTILDWNEASTNDPGNAARWFTDGVHLSSTGQAEFALWLLETSTTLAPSNRLGPPKKLIVPIRGAAVTGIDGTAITVPANATSVALNVTAFQPSAAGHITVWPCENPRPVTSNLNYAPRQIIANNVLAPIDDDGTVCLYSLVSTDIIVDVGGWFTGAPGAATSTGVVGITPKRVVDTRSGLGWPGRVDRSTPLVIDVPGIVGSLPDGSPVQAPNDVSAVSLNITATEPRANGFLTAWPCDEPFPLAATVNYDRGATVGNGAFVAVDGDGQVCIYSLADTEVVVDVQGWVAPSGSATAFTAVTPTRLVDTRDGVGTSGTPRRVTKTTPLEIPIHGVDVEIGGVATEVPPTATAAIVNLVASETLGPGFATVWPCVGTVPLAANLVYETGETRGNGVIAPIGPDGSICVFSLASAEIIVDISGWLTDADGSGGSGGFTGVIPERFVDTRDATGPSPT